MKKKKEGKSFAVRLVKDLKKYSGAYILVLPVVLFYIIFCYKPMYGVIIAFKDFSPARGILESDWAGFRHFETFFNSYYFGRLIKNTLVISISSIIFGFPAPIIFALLLNEVRSNKLKRVTQTISYMPHFISMVVVCSMIHLFTAENGVITSMLSSIFGFERFSLLNKESLFVPIYVISGIWQEIGWGAIIYIAAIAGIDQEQYEAAEIDGANRWNKMIHITLPGIANQVIIMLLLRLGSIMSVGYEKIILLYNAGIYETSDVISSFVYRVGLVGAQWSYSAAVGLFNSVINFILIVLFNRLSRKFTEVSLW